MIHTFGLARQPHHAAYNFMPPPLASLPARLIQLSTLEKDINCTTLVHRPPLTSPP